MRLGVFSDAHANLPAADACIRLLRARGVDRLLFLGDAIGYLGRAAETVDLIAASCDIRLLGNHEAYALGVAPYPSEHEPVYRTQETVQALGPSRLGAFVTLESSYAHREEEGALLFVHGSPWDPLSGCVYPDADLSGFAAVPYRAVVMAHTHRPFVARSGGVIVANCGSCGLPRDRGDAGSCLVIDTATLEAEIVRFPINVREAVGGDPGVHESVVRLFARRPAAAGYGDPGGIA